MKRYWKVGLGLLVLLLMFGPVTCTFFENDQNPTGPTSSVSGPSAANFYASRGIDDTQYGLYVGKEVFVVNIPQAGRYALGYETRLGGFVLIFKISASAMVYVGLQSGDEYLGHGIVVIPDDIILPETHQSIALNDVTDPNVTLLVNTQVIPKYTTDLTSCNGNEDCIINEVKTWIIETPSYTWPNGGTEGTVEELFRLTQGSSVKFSQPRLKELLRRSGVTTTTLAVMLMNNPGDGCCSSNSPCPSGTTSVYTPGSGYTCRETTTIQENDAFPPSSTGNIQNQLKVYETPLNFSLSGEESGQ